MNYGRYEIVKELGKGAMGVVYQAHDPQIDRTVALKVLRPDRVTSEGFVHRFLKEAKAIGRLSHPNIVTVFDIGQDRETVYIAMEFLEGEALNGVIEKRAFTMEEVVQLGAQAAETLDYAHQKGIIHRDVKPGNIIVNPTGQIKITDFGIAHIEDAAASVQTQAGEILGTPAYMSPEQVLSRPVDGRSDLFSLGIILYELSTGRRPFGGDSLAAVFNAITQQDPAAPSKVKPSVPAPLSEVIMKCLRKKPEERFGTGAALAEALRKTIKKPEPAARTKIVAGAKTRKVGSFIIVIAILIMAMGGLSYYFLAGKGRGPAPEAERAGSPAAPAVEKAVPASVPEAGKGGPSLPSAAGETGPSPTPAVGKTPGIPTSPVMEKPVSSLSPGAGKGGSPPPPIAEKVKSGILRIESTPVGAEVFVDGAFKGKAPVKLELPQGKHEVRLTLADHHDWEAQVQLGNKETRLPVRLFPIAEN